MRAVLLAAIACHVGAFTQIATECPSQARQIGPAIVVEYDVGLQSKSAVDVELIGVPTSCENVPSSQACAEVGRSFTCEFTAPDGTKSSGPGTVVFVDSRTSMGEHLARAAYVRCPLSQINAKLGGSTMRVGIRYGSQSIDYLVGDGGDSFALPVAPPMPPPSLPPHPPLSPLLAGEVRVMQHRYSLVASGDVGSFDGDTFKATLANVLGLSTSAIALNITGASVLIEAIITVAPGEANNDVIATTLQNLEVPRVAAKTLNVAVQSAHYMSYVPLVVAPPPTPPINPVPPFIPPPAAPQSPGSPPDAPPPPAHPCANGFFCQSGNWGINLWAGCSIADCDALVDNAVFLSSGTSIWRSGSELGANLCTSPGWGQTDGSWIGQQHCGRDTGRYLTPIQTFMNNQGFDGSTLSCTPYKSGYTGVASGGSCCNHGQQGTCDNLATALNNWVATGSAG